MSPTLRSSHDLNPRSEESLLNAIETEEGRHKVVLLQGDDAEAALTLMQKELDAFGSQRGSKFRKILLRVILELVDGSRRFPADLLLSDIQEGEEVARGAYGVVHEGSWKGKAVALKFPHRSVKDNFKKNFREVIIWRRFSHKNVLPFLGLYRDGLEKIAMVSPWQSHGNVVDFIRKYPGENRHTLLIQATNGLAYLHELDPPIVHSDMKPENILISHERTALLADFGLSHMQSDLTELVSSNHSGVKGTMPYCAPELFVNTSSQCKSSTSRDIWALGMVIYRLFTGEVPFADRPYPKGIWDAIASGDRPKPRKYHDKQRGFTDELWDFLENDCWKMKEKERPSARDCGKRLRELRSRWKIEKAAKLASPFQDLVEEMIVVSPNYRRTLFGRRIAYLQALIERFGVRIAEGPNTKIKFWGDKLNVEAAINNVINDFKNWNAPQKTTFLSVPGRLRGTIIGPGGKDIKALEKEHSVKVTFSDVGEQVSIKGPPDNVEMAKAGLQSTVEYLQLYDDICELQVNQKLIARRLSPKYLRECRAELGLRDLRILTDSSIITMRGPKGALERAGVHFYRLQEEIDTEITLKLTEDIDQLSRLVTGPAWSDIVLKCDGPSNLTLQKSLVTLRREENEVILTGDRALVSRLRAQLDLEVKQRREIVLGMEIPQDFHGDLLREYRIDEIQRTARVLICFPGGKFYDHLPEPQNLLDDLFEVDEQDIVKIKGTLQACTTARQMLKGRVEEEELLQRKVTFKAKYLHEVCLVLPQLKRMGIRVIPSFRPVPPLSPLINLAPRSGKPWILWGLERRFDLSDMEECSLALRGNTTELDKAVGILTQAVRKVSAASYTGCLKFSTDTNFGLLIGNDGGNVRRLETESNTKIVAANANAKKDPCTVKITGSMKDVKQARDKIVRLLDLKWITMENVISE